MNTHVSFWKKAGLVTTTLLSLSSVPAYPHVRCEGIFNRPPEVEKVIIPYQQFIAFTANLKATLSGKLATVWRSEWKTKQPTVTSNQYVYQMGQKFLSPATREAVFHGLSTKSEGFTRQVHERMYALQQANKLTADDSLMVRDQPAPAGAKDTTFTYYTKPIANLQTPGKHQIRIRTYLRQIQYTAIQIGKSVHGSDSKGQIISITREAKDSFLVKTESAASQSESHYSTSEMQAQFGHALNLFAPHGKKFKLEVKTALDDLISNTKFANLAGEHMVQKLDVTLSLNQVLSLFAPLKGKTFPEKQAESFTRLQALENQIHTASPETTARTQAVFDVLRAGVQNNAQFLEVEGATTYHRTAFESTSGFQTTIDRDQGVYAENMYSPYGLKDPLQTVSENKLITTSSEDARHIELKVPVTMMANTVGIQYADPSSAPAPANHARNESDILQAAEIYSSFVNNTEHSGKFNYIRKKR